MGGGGSKVILKYIVFSGQPELYETLSRKEQGRKGKRKGYVGKEEKEKEN